MTSILDQPELKYFGIAVFMLGIAFSIIKWVGRTLREQLGSGVRSTDDISVITHVDTVPPAMVKEAIERGLITPGQLAGMATMERQFVFASIKDRMAVAPRRMSGASFGLASMPMNDKLRVHCPTCGELLALPAFAPFVAHCAQCGTRTAVREDEPGHYLLNVSPAKPEAARGPSVN